MQVITLQFSEKAVDNVTRLADDIGAKDRAEVIRRALSLYMYLLDAKRDGATVIVRGNDNIDREVAIR